MSTAQEIRNRTISVPLDGSALVIECRRPDPMTLITNNILPLDVFHAVLEKFQSWTDTANGDAEGLMQLMVTDPDRWNTFIDTWVCCAAVAPKVVMTEAEAEADPNVLWVFDLEASTRLAIFGATASRKLVSPRVRSAIETFRRDLAARTVAGSDGAAVRDTAVDAAGPDASGAGA